MPRIHRRAGTASITTSSLPVPGAGSSSGMSAPNLAAMSAGLHEGVTFMLGQAGDFLAALPPFGAGQASTLPGQKLSAALKNSGALRSDVRSIILGTLQLGGVVGSLGNLLSPTGPGGCDHNALERCANCATSLPYVMVGAHAIQNRRTGAGKAWGASMCAVGMASVGFHSSSGKWRTVGRRADYWSIALASNLLLRAVYPQTPNILTAAGVALTPFKPFLVSFLNSSAMELRFLVRARRQGAPPELRKAQRLHATTCLLGLSAFALEEVCPQLPLVHAAWHCLSATAVATVNHLLADVEELHLGPRPGLALPAPELA